MAELRTQLEPIGRIYDALVGALRKLSETAPDKFEALRKEVEALANPDDVRAGGTPELDVLSKARKLFGDLQQVDAAPTPQQQTAVTRLQRDTQTALEKWKAISPELNALNTELVTAGQEPIEIR